MILFTRIARWLLRDELEGIAARDKRLRDLVRVLLKASNETKAIAEEAQFKAKRASNLRDRQEALEKTRGLGDLEAIF